MQFESRLPGDRSSRRHINQRDRTAIFLRYSALEAGTRLGGSSAASASGVWSYREIYRSSTQDRPNGAGRALRTSSDDDRSRRVISAAASRMMAKAVGGLAAWGETAFPRLLFAVMSWMMAQALAGCIAYAEAMYSVDLSDPIDCRDPAAGPQPERDDPDQLRSNRMLRDLGISRRDIEYFAGRGDVCE
jgi:hypothetical protein